MKVAIVVDANDIKRILAEKFGVPEANVIKLLKPCRVK